MLEELKTIGLPKCAAFIAVSPGMLFDADQKKEIKGAVRTIVGENKNKKRKAVGDPQPSIEQLQDLLTILRFCFERDEYALWQWVFGQAVKLKKSVLAPIKEDLYLHVIQVATKHYDKRGINDDYNGITDVYKLLNGKGFESLQKFEGKVAGQLYRSRAPVLPDPLSKRPELPKEPKRPEVGDSSWLESDINLKLIQLEALLSAPISYNTANEVLKQISVLQAASSKSKPIKMDQCLSSISGACHLLIERLATLRREGYNDYSALTKAEINDKFIKESHTQLVAAADKLFALTKPLFEDPTPALNAVPIQKHCFEKVKVVLTDLPSRFVTDVRLGNEFIWFMMFHYIDCIDTQYMLAPHYKLLFPTLSRHYAGLDSKARVGFAVWVKTLKKKIVPYLDRDIADKVEVIKTVRLKFTLWAIRKVSGMPYDDMQAATIVAKLPSVFGFAGDSLDDALEEFNCRVKYEKGHKFHPYSDFCDTIYGRNKNKGKDNCVKALLHVLELNKLSPELQSLIAWLAALEREGVSLDPKTRHAYVPAQSLIPVVPQRNYLATKNLRGASVPLPPRSMFFAAPAPQVTPQAFPRARATPLAPKAKRVRTKGPGLRLSGLLKAAPKDMGTGNKLLEQNINELKNIESSRDGQCLQQDNLAISFNLLKDVRFIIKAMDSILEWGLEYLNASQVNKDKFITLCTRLHNHGIFIHNNKPVTFLELLYSEELLQAALKHKLLKKGLRQGSNRSDVEINRCLKRLGKEVRAELGDERQSDISSFVHKIIRNGPPGVVVKPSSAQAQLGARRVALKKVLKNFGFRRIRDSDSVFAKVATTLGAVDYMDKQKKVFEEAFNASSFEMSEVVGLAVAFKLLRYIDHFTQIIDHLEKPLSRAILTKDKFIQFCLFLSRRALFTYTGREVTFFDVLQSEELIDHVLKYPELKDGFASISEYEDLGVEGLFDLLKTGLKKKLQDEGGLVKINAYIAKKVPSVPAADNRVPLDSEGGAAAGVVPERGGMVGPWPTLRRSAPAGDNRVPLDSEGGAAAGVVGPSLTLRQSAPAADNRVPLDSEGGAAAGVVPGRGGMVGPWPTLRRSAPAFFSPSLQKRAGGAAISVPRGKRRRGLEKT